MKAALMLSFVGLLVKLKKEKTFTYYEAKSKFQKIKQFNFYELKKKVFTCGHR